jgi:prolyl oligopeptidase
MRHPIPLLLALSLLPACASSARKPAQSEPPMTDDPYLWLEEIESTRALDFARARNALSEKELMGDRRFKNIEKKVRKILLARDRIPMPHLNDGWVYNFWQDEKHVRGIWRRTRLESYSRKEPDWQILLDVDAVAKEEKENWVYKGTACLPPAYERCLVWLSRGGKDASVVRELDVESRKWVDGGFRLPEAKSRVAWMDRDTLLVGTDFGDGSLTKSGYPRIVKAWKRGTPLAEAKTVFEGSRDDVSVQGGTVFRPEGRISYVLRAVSFFEAEVRLVGADLSLRPVPFPLDAEFQGAFQGLLLAQLRKDWKIGDRTIRAGSLVSLPAGATGPEGAEVVFEPTERSSLLGVSDARGYLYLVVLDNVTAKAFRATRDASGGWKTERMEIPENGMASLVSTNAEDDHLMVQFEGFLRPPTILYTDGNAKTFRPLKSIPARFNPRGLTVEQHEATSKDGTKVPYFVVRRADARGPAPTLLYGYGGFEVPQTPHYAGALGKAWLETGGAYALANIRGGGEFGPRWHQAALKENRQRAFDDFIAVGEDLVARGITSPRRLGIMGGSNGGLLVGATFVQRPDLFRAVVCQVPLLDMLRYHRLLAGASWMAEYGDPDDPAMRAVILRYSPYQNLKPGVEYPRVFVNTSTQDDRVHPGHARKLVARLEELGRPVLYWENIEGGHGGAANIEQRIRKSSLEYTYLFRQLFD